MEAVVQSIIEPDRIAIKAHLETLFAPVREEYPRGLIELCHGPSAPDRAAYFGCHAEGIAEAVEFIARRNGEGQNCYVGVNPRKPNTDRKRRASDQDVECAFFHFADLDRAEAVARARGDLPVRPTMIVMTGTAPNNRPHLYWRLDEPVGNMTAWTERQRGIAQCLDGDAVINPSRIMRLAGTVNFPTHDKLTRGYKVELTSLKTEFASERPAITPEEISAGYPGRTETPQAANDGQTTLSAMRSTRIGDLISACRHGDQWHNNMVRLVAHMAGKGRSDAEIFGLADHITLSGYTHEQTHREMVQALRSARTKWDIPEPSDDVEKEEYARDDADSVFEILDMDELENMPPPTWLVHEMIADHGLSVIYGDPGAGKSFIALDMALRLAMCMDWHGTAAKTCGVLYIAGEGARGIGKRVKGWRKEHGMEGIDAPFLLLPVAVQILDDKERAKLIRTIEAAAQRAGFPIGLTVIDTVSRALAGADENGQEAMSSFVSACGEIQNHIGGAVIAVHHSGKDKERGMRGSTVLLGGCDASIRITKDGEIVTIKTEKQKDAEEASPIYMTMKKIEWATGFEEEQSTLVPMKRGAPEAGQQGMNDTQITKAFEILEAAWLNGNPLSPQPQTKALGRFAPSIIGKAVNAPAEVVASYLTSWLENGVLSIDMVDRNSKKTGLQVVRRLSHGD